MYVCVTHIAVVRAGSLMWLLALEFEKRRRKIRHLLTFVSCQLGIVIHCAMQLTGEPIVSLLCAIDFCFANSAYYQVMYSIHSK